MVVVGAGPTGATAGILLGQYGIDTVVLDRWNGVYPQPRAVHMDDEVCRVVARLGLADRFAAISRPALGLQLRDRHHRVLAEFRRDTTTSAQGYPQANMFDQPELEAVLRDELMRQRCVDVRGRAEVIALEQVDGRVRVTYRDHAGDTMASVDADYVLGCDGANSFVRSTIQARMEDLHFDQRWLVVDVDTDANLQQWEGVHQVCDPVRAATYMRVGVTRYRWEFQLLDGESADQFSNLAVLQPLIAPWVRGIETDRLRLIRVAQYTFRAQIADRWRRGNVFILGDAAHLTPPFIGQGMGAGLRDAHNLAWKLAGVLRGNLPSQVLDSYQAERKPHARAMIRLALLIGRLMTGGGELGDRLRGVAVPRLGLVPGVRRRIVDSSTPALHRSALVGRRRGPRSLTGTLCPNPALPDGRRVDDVRGMGFSIVTAVPFTADQQALADRRCVTVVFAATGSDLARWLRRGRTTAALIRPDGTAMATARRPADLLAQTPRLAVVVPMQRRIEP
ncbi:bifunctional 3-(3-hydroxy-phenyl)propionate/3-hydroxycinnamic acid hydroxylase MhpA [Mycobacterium yunnanensis]|uniref:bifunctional 3-(3-hydroxy-phenyl)propionate/3-hydroxycinnamic acid hydroxylase MhpA n=1 Tax=Mycobacterium yunnanensis TaxID=368477 RepID=UPI0021F331A0|nr:bifunctional 3-(3-hydroxy-phenyl)propionate/3-hydroxycinnamic acid hydroxylase [Mycobacterium yunnanensis]